MVILCLAPTVFPPIDQTQVISITADPESVINNIQQALGILAATESGATSSSTGGSSTTSGGTSTSGGSTTSNPSIGSVGNFFNNLGTVDISETANSDNNTPVTPTIVKGDFAEAPFCRLIAQ